jgi:hypothetical protein
MRTCDSDAAASGLSIAATAARSSRPASRSSTVVSVDFDRALVGVTAAVNLIAIKAHNRLVAQILFLPRDNQGENCRASGPLAGERGQIRHSDRSSFEGLPKGEWASVLTFHEGGVAMERRITALFPGHATLDGTGRHRARFSSIEADFFRPNGSLLWSNIGLGTHGGPLDDATDLRYVDALVEAVGIGVNVLDSAISYRCMRSERAIREAMSRLMAEGRDRSEIIIVTKAGFIPWDFDIPDNARRYIEDRYIRTGICREEDYRFREVPENLAAAGRTLDRTCNVLLPDQRARRPAGQVCVLGSSASVREHGVPPAKAVREVRPSCQTQPPLIRSRHSHWLIAGA